MAEDPSVRSWEVFAGVGGVRDGVPRFAGGFVGVRGKCDDGFVAFLASSCSKAVASCASKSLMR